MLYTLLIDGDPVEVILNRVGEKIEATIGGRTYSLDAVRVQPGVYWLNWQDRSLDAAVLQEGGGYVVSIGSQRIPVEILDPRKALQRSAHGGQDGAAEIRSPMPGKIVRVLVQENDAVEAGQGIVVMEAMKMQNEIKSPKSGVVRSLGAVEGAAINSGDLIARVE
jgi:biotin carboxyl carrier protein